MNKHGSIVTTCLDVFDQEDEQVYTQGDDLLMPLFPPEKDLDVAIRRALYPLLLAILMFLVGCIGTASSLEAAPAHFPKPLRARTLSFHGIFRPYDKDYEIELFTDGSYKAYMIPRRKDLWWEGTWSWQNGNMTFKEWVCHRRNTDTASLYLVYDSSVRAWGEPWCEPKR